MPTSKHPLVIIGGGIIGTSTAYFLSQLHPSREIHIIESAGSLFPSASSRGAGFLAKDWFSSSVADLGALSFDLHKQLAEKHGGREKWGYSGSIGVSIITPNVVEGLVGPEDIAGGDGDVAPPGGLESKKERWESWLFQGTSRAEAAVASSTYTAPADISINPGPLEGTPDADIPPWLKLSKQNQVEVISRPDSTAQIHPLKFCNFLMGECIARGVHLHLNTTATGVLVNPLTGALAGVQTAAGLNIPCSQLLITSGAWTPRVLTTLFPTINPALPVLKVSSLAGHSIVYKRRTPPSASEQANPTTHPTHAIFTTDEDEHFSPEMFSRLATGDIFLAGLNSPNIPIPEVATDDAYPDVDDPSIQRLHKVGERLLREEDLEIVKTGLCHRPVLPDGKPVMGRIPEEALGIAAVGGVGGLGTPGSTRRSSNSSDISVGSSSSRRGSGGSGEAGNGVPGVYTCVGHGPWGIALGPGSGLVMAEMLEGRKTSADVSLMSVEHLIEQSGGLM